MDPLATPDQLEAHTKGAVTADDPRALPALRSVSTAVRRRCGWHVAPSTSETITLDGPGSQYLGLPSMHVTDVAGVFNAGEAIDVETALAAGTLEWSALGSLRYGGYFTARYRGVQVTLTHGYELDEVEDIVGVVLAITARGLASPMGQTREQAGGLAVTWSSSAPGVAGGIAATDDEKAIIDVYRIP